MVIGTIPVNSSEIEFADTPNSSLKSQGSGGSNSQSLPIVLNSYEQYKRIYTVIPIYISRYDKNDSTEREQEVSASVGQFFHLYR